MAKTYSKVNDYVFRKSETVDNIEEIHIKQLKDKKALIERILSKKKDELTLINNDISEAKKIGVDIAILDSDQ